jgi:hypothetical protein
MNDDDLIRRGDATRQADRWIRGFVEADTIGKAIAALPAVSAPVAVRVRDLEWRDSYGVLRAETPFGDYKIAGKLLYQPGYPAPSSVHDSDTEAKAAAQADYAARIMATIDVVDVAERSADKEAFLAWLDSLPKEPNDKLKEAYAAYKATVKPAPDVAELNDPVAVHVNMLRGTIAKPTVEQIVHLYGVDALCKALAPVIVREAEAALPAVSAPVAELVEALRECTEWMESLRASGDAGFWDWKDDEYTRAIAALAKIGGQ